MLRADPIVAALACLRIPELAALPLTHGIPADDHIAALHQSLAKRLIVCLPVLCVAGRDENGRVFRILTAVVVVGHVQKRCHVFTREAFEDQLFNVKAVHRNASGDVRVQRSSCRGQSSEHGQKLLTYFVLHAQQVLLGANPGPDFHPLLVFAPSQLSLILKIGCDLGTTRNHWQYRERLGRRSRSAQCVYSCPDDQYEAEKYSVSSAS